MNDWLLVRLPSGADEAPTWAAADAAGALLSLPASDTTEGSPAVLAAGRRVALLVPAADVTLFAPPLPTGNEARLQQLAPFALEEQVSQDVELLHFAVGMRDGQSGQVPVAVVDRERMRKWLAQAADLGLEPRAMYAESDLAPLLPGHVTLLFTDGQLLLRDDRNHPMALPADDPELALTAVLGAERQLADTHLAVYASPEDWPGLEAGMEALRERVASLKVQLFAGGVLGLYAQGLASAAPVNLMQGEFKAQTKSGNAWLRWRTAAALLAGLLILHAAGTFWELRQLRQAAAELDESIARVYGTIFPGQQPGPAPRLALEARLQQVAGADSPRGELMPLLAALAAARANVPVAALDSLSYKPGSLQLKLSAPDATTLEQFSQALRAGGYGAQVASGNAREGVFEGQIDVTAAGS
ncbi:MAG TPA: type II secretion system protein GspL [Steroidobacteraceae bacterium]|nr:type II secretion system protein GspL [Steroidobacteraceae bacterium]